MDGQQWRDGSHDRYNDVALKWRYEISLIVGGIWQVRALRREVDDAGWPDGGRISTGSVPEHPSHRLRWKGQRDQVDIGYLNTISDTQEFETRIYHYDSSRKSSLINTDLNRNDFQPRNNQVLGIEPRYTQRMTWGPPRMTSP